MCFVFWFLFAFFSVRMFQGEAANSTTAEHMSNSDDGVHILGNAGYSHVFGNSNGLGNSGVDGTRFLSGSVSSSPHYIIQQAAVRAATTAALSTAIQSRHLSATEQGMAVASAVRDALLDLAAYVPQAFEAPHFRRPTPTTAGPLLFNLFDHDADHSDTPLGYDPSDHAEADLGGIDSVASQDQAVPHGPDAAAGARTPASRVRDIHAPPHFP